MMRLRARHLALLVPFLLVGCTLENVGQPASSGSGGAASDADRVFAASGSGANGLVLTGIWEASQAQKAQTLESKARFEFRETFVVAAARCTMPGADTVVVGKKAAASVGPGLIEIKESISETKMMSSNAACGVRMAAGLLPECDPNVPTTQRTTCFDLTGGTLSLFQAGTPMAFVKIAD